MIVGVPKEIKAAELRVALTPVGRVEAGAGTAVLFRGRGISMERAGWRHR